MKSQSAWKTRAAFMMPNCKWIWLTWNNSYSNKHAAILEKASELNATAWDFSQADHDEIDRANF